MNNLLKTIVSVIDSEVDPEKSLFYKNESGLRHINCLEDAIIKTGVNCTAISEEQISLALNSSGYIVFRNAGRIKDKYMALLYLPASLSPEQIDFFKDNKSLFEENFDYLKTIIYSDKKTNYGTQNRDLDREAIIDGIKINHVELLYREIQTQELDRHKKSM